MTSLGKTGGRGAVLGTVGQFGKLTINLASLVVLARILSPHDYGLVAMVTAVIGFAELVRDMGLSSASIQAKTLTKAQQVNLWWANTGLGATCTILAAGASPLLTWVYGQPEVLGICLSLSVTFLISGAATQYRTDLVRKLHMGRISIADISSGLLAFAGALTIALNGGGYWALVFQQVAANALSLISLGILAGWLPRRYDRDISISSFFRFGMPVFGSSVLTYFATNVDTILVGKFFGTVPLGYYNRGMQVIRMPMNQIRNPLNTVALSTLSRVQDQPERFDSMVVKAQLVFLYPVTFITLWIAATANDSVVLILGQDWEQVAPLVAIFALGDALSNLSSAGGWVYLAKGRSGALLKYTIISAAVRITLFCIMLPFGFMALASVYAIAPIFLWPLSLWICARATGYNTTVLFITSLRLLLACLVPAVLTYSFAHADLVGAGPGRWVLSTVIYGLVFALLTLTVPRVRKDIRTTIKTLAGVLGR